MFWKEAPSTRSRQRKPRLASSNEADRVIGAEMEILTSWDLAVQVAQAIGPQRLLPPAQDLLSRVATGNRSATIAATLWGIATEGEAAGSIASGLKVISNKGSNIILVSYKNREPADRDARFAGTVKSLFRQAS